MIIANHQPMQYTKDFGAVLTLVKRSTCEAVILTAVSIILSGCAGVITPGPACQPKLQSFEIPKIGEVRKVTTGDTVAERRWTYTIDAIDLKNEVSGGDGVVYPKFIIPSGILYADNETADYRIFTTTEASSKDFPIWRKKETAGLAISKKDPSEVKVYTDGVLFKPSNPPQFTIINTNALSKRTWKRELIYGGMTGNSLKFTYRKWASDQSEAVNQEVQCDLAGSNTVVLKGVRLDILNSSDTKLEYRVLTTFPEKDADQEKMFNAPPTALGSRQEVAEKSGVQKTSGVGQQVEQPDALKKLTDGWGKLQKNMTGSQVVEIIGGGWDFQAIAVDACIRMKKGLPCRITSDAYTLIFGTGGLESWTLKTPPLVNTGQVVLQMAPN